MITRICEWKALAFLLVGLTVAGGRLALADHTAIGVGDVVTPVFTRFDLGYIGSRFHEPDGDADGNLWMTKSPTMYKYNIWDESLTTYNYNTLTGRSAGHLSAISHGDEVYMTTPTVHDKLYVFDKTTETATGYNLPQSNLDIYWGAVDAPTDRYAYLYDNDVGGVMKWDSLTHTGDFFQSPPASGGLPYMYSLDTTRGEYYGATWNTSGGSNQILKFDTTTETWDAPFSYSGPLSNVSATPANTIFNVGGNNILYMSDMVNGRIIPYDVDAETWGTAIPVPGYGDWFGYMSGGVEYDGKLYMVHSSWTGGGGSMCAHSHHFIGSLTVFDPVTQEFSRLDAPPAAGETTHDIQADYMADVAGELAIMAVHRTSGQGSILRTGGGIIDPPPPPTPNLSFEDPVLANGVYDTNLVGWTEDNGPSATGVWVWNPVDGGGTSDDWFNGTVPDGDNFLQVNSNTGSAYGGASTGDFDLTTTTDSEYSLQVSVLNGSGPYNTLGSINGDISLWATDVRGVKDGSSVQLGTTESFTISDPDSVTLVSTPVGIAAADGKYLYAILNGGTGGSSDPIGFDAVVIDTNAPPPPVEPTAPPLSLVESLLGDTSGLDFGGTFAYALSGGSAGGSHAVGDASFVDVGDAAGWSVTGVTKTAPTSGLDDFIYTSPKEFGASPDDNNLETVLNSVTYGDGIETIIEFDVIADRPYKLQILDGANYAFDVFLDIDGDGYDEVYTGWYPQDYVASADPDDFSALVGIYTPTVTTLKLRLFTRGDSANGPYTSFNAITLEDLSSLILGDTNGDDLVDETDAQMVASNWQKTGLTGGAIDGDFDGDGDVDDIDAAILATNWSPSPVAVPEPATMAMILAAILTLGLFRRRTSFTR